MSQHSHSHSHSPSSSSPSILVPIATGTEEMEAVILIDTLRRAGGEVTVANVTPLDVHNPLEIIASRGVKLAADVTLQQVIKQKAVFDAIILPGGMKGAEHFRDSQPLIQLLQQQDAAKKRYGAICASPALVFGTHKLLKQHFTCHPSVSDKVGLTADAVKNGPRVVVDQNCITSMGPGTSLEFALAWVIELFGLKKAEEVAAPMMINFSLPVAHSHAKL